MSTATTTPLSREALLPYVGHCVDDALHYHGRQIPPAALPNARIVGWQCGFEPMCVAVVSYLPGVRLDDEEATELAIDLLQERKWFANGVWVEPDFVI